MNPSPPAQNKFTLVDLYFNVVGYLLFILTLPAFLENAFEVYVGTVLAGPQMIGFTLAHASPDSALVRTIRYSSIASIVFSVYALVAVMRILTGRIASRHQKFFVWFYIVLCIHNLIVSFYGYWSPLFSKSK